MTAIIRFAGKTALKTIGVLAAASGVAFGAGYAGSTAHAGAAPLVYVCPDSQGSPPSCANYQEFEAFDYKGSPIFSVPEAGPVGAFGTPLADFQTDVFHPNVTMYGDSPVDYYGTQSCTAPANGALWIDSLNGGEFWTCFLGTWTRHLL